MRSSAISIALLLAVAAATAIGLARIAPGPTDTGGAAAIGEEDLPDFTTISSAQERKTYFVHYLGPIIAAANDRIRKQRRRLEPLVTSLLHGDDIGADAWRWMRALAQQYEVPADDRAHVAVGLDLLRKVDVIPASLVLVQAAKESGWGTSRFAQKGNNLFGQHCFDAGCGIVPAQRAPGQHHEVETFDTVRASVRSYLHNLNTHPRYKRLRTIREQLRDSGEPVTGLALARGLQAYSERRNRYISEVRGMINDLDLASPEQSP